MSKEAEIFDHNYATENIKKVIDYDLFDRLQNYGAFRVGEKQFYERKLVLFALKDFSEKAVSDFKSSLIERLEEEMGKVDVDWEGNRDLEILEVWQKAIELINNHGIHR